MQFVHMDRMLSNEVGSSHLLQENIDLICNIYYMLLQERAWQKKLLAVLTEMGLRQGIP